MDTVKRSCLLLLAFVAIVSAQTFSYPSTTWSSSSFPTCFSGNEQSPISISRPQYICSGNNAYYLITNPGTTTFTQNSGAPQVEWIQTSGPGATLQARDVNLAYQEYTLQKIQVHTPAENRITGAGVLEQLEIQMYFTVTLSANTGFNVAVVSWLFANYDGETNSIGQKFTPTTTVNGLSVNTPGLYNSGNNQYYAPYGDFMVTPFLPKTTTSAQTTIDLSTTFGTANSNYPGVYTYQGSLTYPPCTQNVNWYINQRIFSMQSPDFGKFKVNGQDTARPVQSLNNRQIEFTGCYSNYFQTEMRSDFGLWAMIIIILFFFFYTLGSEHNTIQVFNPRFQNNKWTNHPIYSLWYLGHDAFYTKTSRAFLLLVSFSMQQMVEAILFGQLYGQYFIANAIMIWYAAIAVVCSWIVVYFFGIIITQCRKWIKSKFEHEGALKKEQNKESSESHRLMSLIDIDEEKIFTYQYIFYLLGFFTVLIGFIISIWQMANVIDVQYERYWVATFFIGVGLDLVILDIFVALLFGNMSWFHLRGFWYDAELGRLYKEAQEE